MRITKWMGLKLKLIIIGKNYLESGVILEEEKVKQLLINM